MSFEAENPDHENESVDAVKENTQWLKVVANILGEMQDIEPQSLYEDQNDDST